MVICVDAGSAVAAKAGADAPGAAFPYVFAAEGAQHPPNKSPRSTVLAASSATLNDPAQSLQKIETNLPEDILVTLYYVRWSCVRSAALKSDIICLTWHRKSW